MFVPLSGSLAASSPRANSSPRACARPSASAPVGSPASRCKAGSATAGAERWPAKVLVLARSQGPARKSAQPVEQSPVRLRALTWMRARTRRGVPWGLAQYSLHPWLLVATLAIQVIQSAVRIGCCSPVLRSSLRSWASRCARSAAIGSIPSPPFARCSRYSRARIRHEPLVWLKTEHAYPSRSALLRT